MGLAVGLLHGGVGGVRTSDGCRSMRKGLGAWHSPGNPLMSAQIINLADRRKTKPSPLIAGLEQGLAWTALGCLAGMAMIGSTFFLGSLVCAAGQAALKAHSTVQR